MNAADNNEGAGALDVRAITTEAQSQFYGVASREENRAAGDYYARLGTTQHHLGAAVAELVGALKDALAEVEHYAPRGKELGGPFADAVRARAAAALARVGVAP